VFGKPNTFATFGALMVLTYKRGLRYMGRMPIQFILPKKFTRAQIELQMDELALKFQRSYDKKIIAQISALSRLLAKMKDREPKNRQ
jgi:hypothetical protein